MAKDLAHILQDERIVPADESSSATHRCCLRSSFQQASVLRTVLHYRCPLLEAKGTTVGNSNTAMPATRIKLVGFSSYSWTVAATTSTKGQIYSQATQEW